MPFNALQVPDFGVEKRRLEVLLDELSTAFASGAFTTREELLQMWSDIVGEFQASVGQAVFDPMQVQPDSAPDADLHNEEMRDISRDLSILFIRLKLLGELIVSTFNQTAVERDELLGSVRRVAGLLTDLKLYEGASGEIVSESFTTTNSLDIGSSKLTQTEASVVLDEGVVTLGEATVTNATVESVELDQTTFNGVLGNNEGLNVLTPRDNLNSISDFNADTWTEFEKTYFLDQAAEVEPLVVNLRMTLAESQIVNRIMIDPVNFGTLDEVEVVDIRVSNNGQDWTSVKGSIPLKEYAGETETDVYVLNPTTSLWNGKLTYTFLPHKTKHVAVHLRKNKPYIFPTTLGVDKLRMAIGIRSIDVKAVEFVESSEIISKARSVTADIFKVGLLSAYRPTNSAFGSVDFFVSVDDGQSWKAIQPLARDSFDTPEVLTFDDLQEVNSFLWKAVLKRNTAAFSSTDSFSEIDDALATKAESTIVSPEVTPALISPTETLASSNVSILETIASRGPNGTTRVPFSVGSGTGGQLELFTPFLIDELPAGELVVSIGGVKWTKVSNLSLFGSSDLVYRIESDEGVAKLVFGDGVNGKAVPAGVEVELYFIPEQVAFSPISNGYAANLRFSADGVVSRSSLERLGSPSSVVSYILPKGQTSIELKHKNIISTEATLHDWSFQIVERNLSGTIVVGVYQNEKTSIDDLVAAGDYHVDYVNGRLTSFSASSSINITVVSYRYLPLHVGIPFTYSTNENGFDRAVITQDNFVAEAGSDITGQDRSPIGFQGYFFPPSTETQVSDGTGTIIRLSQGSIVRGSLVIPNDLFASADEPVEVEFVNGHDELYQNLVVESETIPDVTTGSPINHTFTLAHGSGGNLFAGTGVVFSRSDLFTTLVGGTPSSLGEYNINFSTGVIQVYVDGTEADIGTVSYTYESAVVDYLGRYSVDYANGLIYCIEAPQNGKSISYRYTLYRLKYNVARVLPEDMFSVSVEDNSISLETEQLFSGRVDYIYEYIPELVNNLVEVAPYYTPVLRDLRFRVLDQSII